MKADLQEHEQLRKESSAHELDRRREFQQTKSFSDSDIGGGFTEISEAANGAQNTERVGKGSTSKKGSKSRMDEGKSSLQAVLPNAKLLFFLRSLESPQRAKLAQCKNVGMKRSKLYSDAHK